MRFRICLLLLAFVACAKFAGCATVQYDGPVFEPTEKVIVYYDISRIQRKYEVMGTATASTWYSYRGDMLRASLLDKARAIGADAVLIQSVQENVGEPARVNGENPVDGGRLAGDNSGVALRETQNTENPQTTVSVKTSRIVADFLKFKD
ncbi:MAG: hypothetical protein JW808_04465 [Victivallales bacterium]|nr:hypothetical protein [Victivallales bacterium]